MSERTPGAAEGQGGLECVLVVDDDAVVRTLVCRMLSSVGYSTVEAASGEEALVAIDDNLSKFTLVISDIIMPGICGVKLAQWLRTKAPSTPILLITGFVHMDIRSEFHNPQSVLFKPFTRADLLGKVKDLLEGDPSARAPEVAG